MLYKDFLFTFRNIHISFLEKKIYFKFLNVKHGKIRSLGYIFEKTAYLSDCNDMSIINNKELKNLNHLIIDCLKIKKKL